MAYKAKISPKLARLSEKGKNGQIVNMVLSDGREIACRFEMLTYANASDEDDTDVMVASVKYGSGYGELLTEEDIKEILD